eukprot:5467675-Amphidinium_carterae.1
MSNELIYEMKKERKLNAKGGVQSGMKDRRSHNQTIPLAPYVGEGHTKKLTIYHLASAVAL